MQRIGCLNLRHLVQQSLQGLSECTLALLSGIHEGQIVFKMVDVGDDRVGDFLEPHHPMTTGYICTSLARRLLFLDEVFAHVLCLRVETAILPISFLFSFSLTVVKVKTLPAERRTMFNPFLFRSTVLAACLASSNAFQAPLLSCAHLPTSQAANFRAMRSSTTPVLRTHHTALMMAAMKESALDHAGKRAIEEEERRISLWKVKFDLNDEQVATLRKSFEDVLSTVNSPTRALPKQKMKLVIENTNVVLDAVDVGNEGRPSVQQDELQNYIKALAPLWAETCNTDAVEVANGECLVPLDTDNFDLSECLAIFGMCLREHCGIGGVCFWDTPGTPQAAGSKTW